MSNRVERENTIPQKRLQDLYRQGTSKSTKASAPLDTIKLIGFRLHEEEFVIELERVKEIISLPPVTRVSRSPDFVEGIANIRGEILQILNFHQIIDLPPPKITEKTRIVVIDSTSVLAGIIVDQVAEVIEVERSAIQLTPEIIAGDKARFIKGIIKEEKRRSILWLDCSAIYSEYLAQTSM